MHTLYMHTLRYWSQYTIGISRCPLLKLQLKVGPRLQMYDTDIYMNTNVYMPSFIVDEHLQV